MSEIPTFAGVLNGGQFHHIGCATKSIARERQFLGGLGYVPESAVLDEPALGVVAQFLVGGGPRIELLQPSPGATVLDPWLGVGPRFYHLAYTVPDLEGVICALCIERAKVLVPPILSHYFGSRRLAFLILPNQLLVELIAADAGA